MKKNIGQIGLKFGIVGLFILGLFMIGKMRNDNNMTDLLSKTKSIVVNNLIFDKDTLEEKKIVDKKDIDEIIKIILNGTEMPKDKVVPYKALPSYRL